MINDYQYENLFSEHFAANFIIVDSSASVTINAGIAPTISGEEFLITNTELQNETIKLKESLCSENNLTFGKMEASKLTFTFKNKSDYPTDLTGEEIDVYLYFDYDSSTLFKVGRYTIENDKYSDNNYVRNITAYDMIYYLKDTDITAWYYEYYGDGEKHMLGLAIISLFNWLKNDPNGPQINIQLESGYNLCNGTFSIGQTIESDSITFEYYMQRVLEFNGAFGHINRQGNYEFITMKWYDADPVRTITNDDRIPATEHDIVSTWGIGGIDVYDQDNIRICKYRNTNKKHPSVYNIVDSFVTSGYEKGDSTLKAAVQKLHNVIHHYNYKSCNVKTTGDLCVEVGDRINVDVLPDEGENRGWFRSYVLERTFTGIQGMIDVYKSKGDKKQPKYIIDQKTSHIGDSDAGTDGSDGVSIIEDEHDRNFCEIIRNIGYRLLDNPSDVECIYAEGDASVKFKWSDPADIATSEPDSATWAGTIVVRKEGSRPRHEWDGDVIVNSTTRDAYKNTYLVDNTIQENKQYYYGIFPYHVKDGKKWTRFTTIISVNTDKIISAPEFVGEPVVEGLDVTLQYIIPHLSTGSYTTLKLAAKKDRIPIDIEDADIDVDIQEETTAPYIGEATIQGLDEESLYYFVIFAEDDQENAVSSDPIDCMTGIGEGYDFAFTGSEQTFEVPETGIYTLKVWGAQGESNSNARGGYGGYAEGDIQLTAGQTLYINVGGQNGYNGGGNYQHGTIRNILIPDSGQSFIIDERCWTQTGTTQSAVYPDSTLSCFALGRDMGKIRNEIGRNNYVILWERNGIKCYVGITSTNASFGEPKFCCAIYNEKNERVLGSLVIRETYSQEFGPYCGFDAATEDWYNSNVRARLYHWGLAYGVDDTNHLGYVVHCYGQHRGYYENTNLYLPQASYDSSYYGWNAAKLYDALIRASQ